MTGVVARRLLDFTPSGGRCTLVPCPAATGVETGVLQVPPFGALASTLTIAATALLAAVGSGGSVRSPQAATPFGVVPDIRLAFVDLRRSAALPRPKGTRSTARVPHRSTTPAITTIERLGHVRTELSLTIAQLAATLRVSRLAVYGWLDGAQPRGQNLLRLKQLSDIADSWAKRSKAPLGSLVVTPLPQGPRLFDLMQEVPLNQSAIARALDTLHRVMSDRPRRLASQALADEFEPVPKGATNESIRRIVHRHGPKA